MSPPEVALVVPALAGGGAQRAALTLVGMLHRHGIAVELVLFRRWGPLSTEVPDGVPVVELGTRRAVLAVPGLARYLRRRRPATVLACMDHVIVATVIAARLSRSPARLVGWVQNTMSEVAGGGGWSDRLRPVLARRLYGKCDAIVAVSKGVADDLVHLGIPERVVETIYNPIPVDEIEHSAAGPAGHRWLDGEGPPVIVGIGRLTPQKDFGTLLEAFARLRARTRARLVILGEGEQRVTLEQRAAELGVADDVSLPGFVTDPAPYLSRAAVFVLSSAWEGFGLVVVEALAAGTPVVATDCPSGPSEILDGGRFGRLVGVGDAEAMAEAIAATLSEQPDRHALRNRARAFSPDALLGDYLRVLGLEG